jgi:hypothetical protein
MARLVADYTKIKELEYLDANDLLVIELKAKALELPECFDFLGVALEDIHEKDLILARKAHKRGRAKAISEAADMLFHSMKGRAGSVASMEYLRQMSGTFKAEAVPVGASGAFKFNVILGDDKSETEQVSSSDKDSTKQAAS